MTDEEVFPPDEGEEPTSVRRVGRKDRKTRLRKAGELFPVQMATPTDGVEAALPEAAPRTLVVTPPEERFPQIPTPRKKRDAERNLRLRELQSPMAQRRTARQNRIALVFFAATVGIAAYFVYIWLNPYSPLNLLAPARPLLVVTATPPGMIAFPFTLANPIAYSGGADCETLTITGTIQARPGESYAVRALNALRDEGVLAVANGESYRFQFNLPNEGGGYTILLFDTEGTQLAEAVEVSEQCTANFVFAPGG